MEPSAGVIEKHLKKTTIASNVISVFVALVVAAGVGYGFYYNTNSTLTQHSIDINDVKEDVKSIKESISNTDVFKGMTTTEQQNLEDRMKKIEDEEIRIEDKQDKILEMLTLINNK